MRSFAGSVPTLVYLATCSLCALTLACDASDDAPAPSGADREGRDASSSGDVLDASRAPKDAGSARDDARTTLPESKDAARANPDAGVNGPPDAPDATSSGGAEACTTPEEQKFSFFLISFRAIQRESGSLDGFGGDLGGIRGADAICQRVAEYSSPCQKSKVWRAFLSTTKEHAIDRIGKGPWYDRLGRLIANSRADLMHDRPLGAHPQIIDDLPNEDGVPNRNPDGSGAVDNHQTLTGSGVDGQLYRQGDAGTGNGSATSCAGEPWTPEKATCWDWTSAEPAGCPRVGHSWPRQGSGLNWISVWNEGGCAPGAVLADRGGSDGTRRVGSGGGYGGFYCFALATP